MEFSIRPSSAAWAVNGTVISDTSQGCLRNVFFNKVFPTGDIPKELAEMGAWGEDEYQKALETEQEWPFHKEFAFSDVFEGAKRRGRVDFITYHNNFLVIHEVKTSQSKNFLYQNLRKGEPKLNHLAQLVFYLVYFEQTRGKLIYRYAPKNELKIIKVEIKEGGKIYYDGKLYPLTVSDQIAHQLMSAEAIKEMGVIERPSGKACEWCSYKDMCNEYDQSGQTMKEFLGEKHGS
jgi:hypothetical protein